MRAVTYHSHLVGSIASFVVEGNAGSLRVLRKAGFKIVGTETSFAQGRNTEIDETILRLD